MKRFLSFVMCAVMAFSALCCLPQELSASASLAVSAAEKISGTDLLPYAYGKLTEKEKKQYLEIRRAVINHESEVKVSAIPVDTFKKLAEILWFSDVMTCFVFEDIYYSSVVGYVYSVTFDYKFTKKEYNKIINEAEKSAEHVISKFSEKTGRYSKVKYIHDYIIKKTSYEIEPANSNNIYGALNERKAKCDGYSHAFEYICLRAGIEAVTVVGEMEDEGHAWNKVRINNKWYNIDVTSDDPISMYKDNTDYSFFLISDKMMRAAGYKELDVLYSVPEAVTDGGDYYTRKGLCASSLGEAKELFVSEVANAAKNGKGKVAIRLSDKATFDDFVDCLTKKSSDVCYLLSKAEKQSGEDIITYYYRFIPCRDSMYTVTVYFFYPGTKASDYFTDVKSLKPDTVSNLKDIGLAV